MLQQWQERISRGLQAALPAPEIYPRKLHQALHHAVHGGKRVRGCLVLAAGRALQQDEQPLMSAALAVEMIHAYSLVHDDLPAMDDDDLRRGQPTLHKAFDEATAILAGDGLQTLAFQQIARDPRLSAAARLKMIQVLADAAGPGGMVGGQAMDLDAEGRELSLPELENLHIHKTGALIRASLLLACDADPTTDSDHRAALDRYGKCLGLAFQIQDDVLDGEGSAHSLGKTPGKDQRAHKTTYLSLLGPGVAKRRADELFDDAIAALDVFGDQAAALTELTALIRRRQN
ncbi:MAG: polyprenyl synthetase family protein [Panacagrimonas sp.]